MHAVRRMLSVVAGVAVLAALTILPVLAHAHYAVLTTLGHSVGLLNSPREIATWSASVDEALAVDRDARLLARDLLPEIAAKAS